MAETIRIKRRTGGGAGAPSTLANAELAFNEVEDTLYYGKGTGGAGGSASTIIPIGGTGAFVDKSSAQTVAGVKTFSSSPVVPTPTAGDNSTKAASTAFVATAVTNGIAPTSQAANTVYAAPNGSAGNPTFRLLAAADIPNLTASKITDFSTAADARITAQKGVANGIATLDGAGLIPSNQLPSYVDDVLEFANLAGFPGSGTTGKIYVALDTNKQYRWSGSAYVELVTSPGSTDSVVEGSTNLYFTEPRVRNTVLTGLNIQNAAISATDSVLVALGKAQGQIANKLDLNGTIDGGAF